MPSIFAGHYDPSFPLALCLKDLGLIEELIAETGARHELTSATHARFSEARDRYGERAGEMTVCKLIEDDAGVSLRVEGDWTPPWEVKHPSEAAARSELRRRFNSTPGGGVFRFPRERAKRSSRRRNLACGNLNPHGGGQGARPPISADDLK